MGTAVKSETQHLYEQAIRARFSENAIAHLPGWLQSLHLQGLSRFETLGFPTRRNEAWKYVNLRPVLDTAFRPYDIITPAAAVDADLYTVALETKGPRLVFINGQFNGALSSEAPEGIELRDLRAVYDTNPKLLQQYLGHYVEQESDAFVALNTALFENGAVVSVKDDFQSDALVQILFINTASDETPRAAYPRNLFIVGKNARLNLLVQHVGLGGKTYLTNAVQELVVDEGGEINVTLVQNEGPEGWHFSGTRAFLQHQAKASLSTISLGAKTSRQTVKVLLRGEESECHLNGLNVLKDSSEVYHNTVIEHWVPRCVSRQYYKGILDDDAKSEFSGTIFVAPEAQLTDSEQMNRNLVLSDNARVFSRPQLEINADDVKCAHGATVGQLEDEQLFYLASRGIDRESAESILTYGFAEEIIQRIPQPEVRHYIDGIVFKNLHQANATVVNQLAR